MKTLFYYILVTTLILSCNSKQDEIQIKSYYFDLVGFSHFSEPINNYESSKTLFIVDYSKFTIELWEAGGYHPEFVWSWDIDPNSVHHNPKGLFTEFTAITHTGDTVEIIVNEFGLSVQSLDSDYYEVYTNNI